MQSFTSQYVVKNLWSQDSWLHMSYVAYVIYDWGSLRTECQHCKAKFLISERLSRSSTQTFFIDVAVQANVGSERFGDIDTGVMTDLRQMLQLNNSNVRSFVSIDEQLQSGLLPQLVSLELLACMSLACSLSTVLLWAFRSLSFAKWRGKVKPSRPEGPWRLV